MVAQQPEDPVLAELRGVAGDLVQELEAVNAAAKLLEILPSKYEPAQVRCAPGNRAWELVGLFFLNRNRFHEALGIFWRLYEHMLDAQNSAGRAHKGMVLLWISECFFQLGFPVHAKRYLMLTLCEDAISFKGNISPQELGVYFRLVWRHGLSDESLRRYAQKAFALAQQNPDDACFPESVLQQIDDDWITEIPSSNEAFGYRVNERYVRRLLGALSQDDTGKKLERLAGYLMSCMPGCRVQIRRHSPSTDYDLICSIDGIEVDFRSEFGRHFVCECKDLDKPADFTTMAKFCRVLDSTKSRFGILFSTRGISGGGKPRDAGHEQMKVFQDRGIVIVVLDREDLEEVAAGKNLITLLRKRYEDIRLDLKR